MEFTTNSDYIKTVDDFRLNNQQFWGMEDNDEYFNWSDGLKLHEEKSKPESKTLRKRRLSGNYNGYAKVKLSADCRQLKNPFETAHVGEKQNICVDGVQRGGTSRMPTWQIDDISDLNADLEGSLGTLKNDIANNTYGVSETMLNLAGLPVFKQEAPSPTSNEHASLQHIRKNQNSSNVPSLIPANRNLNVNDGGSNTNSINNDNNLQHFLNGNYNTLEDSAEGNVSNPPPGTSDGFNNVLSGSSPEDCRFQYVLAAATSIATKVNEDTLTYLNQGQSYEIKLKKLGDLSTYRGKLLKSVIRICFYERRLQYMEKEQMMLWQKSRPGDRILEIDVPLSYGLSEVIQPNNSLNAVYFTWDPTKEVGVYIKVNCISTEFTPRKHGGEKGVPFRIQVETYQNGNGLENSRRLHAAACQVKVFKLKGADRKHKQDREKILKRPISEQEKYQPSYECTVLNDVSLETISMACVVDMSRSLTPESDKESNPFPNPDNGSTNSKYQPATSTDTVDNDTDNNAEVTDTEESLPKQLLCESNPEATIRWLSLNRFSKYLETFANFSGADMLRMSKCDLIQICGQADGIRLYNALHNKSILPKLKLFVCHENISVYNAIYLTSNSKLEMISKLAPLVSLSQDQVKDVYILGPQHIKIILTNEVIQHIKDETMFMLNTIEDNNTYYLLLKPLQN